MLIDLFQEVWEICSKKVDLFHTKDVWGNSVIDCLCINTCPNSINWMKRILRLAIVNRWKSLGLRLWRVDVRNKIDNFPNTNDVMARQQYVVSIFSILTKYEFLETLSLLELAIWKTKIEDDDDYYSPDYLKFMLHELISRNVSLVKLGAWPQFMGRWEGNSSAKGAELSGSMWYLNVTNSKARMGYGFSYFFSRAAGRAGARRTSGARARSSCRRRTCRA